MRGQSFLWIGSSGSEAIWDTLNFSKTTSNSKSKIRNWLHNIQEEEAEEEENKCNNFFASLFLNKNKPTKT